MQPPVAFSDDEKKPEGAQVKQAVQEKPASSQSPAPANDKQPQAAKQPSTAVPPVQPNAAGSAQQAGSTQQAAATGQPAAWHRVQMRLSGSMCPACIKELEDNIKKLPGIALLKFERPQIVFSAAVSPDVWTWADGVVLYDVNKLSLESLRLAIKQNGYHTFHVVDRELDHEPDLKDLKFAR